MKKSSGCVEGLRAELLDTVTDLVNKMEKVDDLVDKMEIYLQRTWKFVVLCVACLFTVAVAFLFFRVACNIL